MKAFRVPVREVKTYYLSIVEAESYDEAVEVAKEAYIVGDYTEKGLKSSVYINKEKLI